MRLCMYFCLLVMIYSCGDYESTGSKKGYLGNYGDAMVVCTEDFWSSTLGDSVKVLLTDYVPAMMPAQGQLDLEFTRPRNFEGAARRFRNSIVLDIGDRLNNQTPNIKTTEGEYAVDQLIFYCYAKTPEAMITLLSERYLDIINKINDKEIIRKQTELSQRLDSSAMKSIMAKKNYEVLVPQKYTVLVDSGNVLWMNKTTSIAKGDLDNYIVRDIVITTYDYDSQSVFELDSLIAKRDEVLRKVTYDEEDGTYIRFQEKVDPTLRILSGENNYKLEVRSVWTKEGAFQGGPSVQYVQLDYDNRRVIHADARIYAPNNSKREIMRELEAIIKSVKPLD